MKKLLSFIACSFFVVFGISAQTHNTVNVDDEVYKILSAAESKGLCATLQNAKPYTERYINIKLDEIIKNVGEDSREGKIALYQKNRFARKEDGFDWRTMTFATSNRKSEKYEKVPITFVVDDTITTNLYGGIYKGADNAFGYEVINELRFRGDIGKKFSYSCLGFVEAIKMPLETVGKYYIGKWWYEEAGSPDADIKRYINATRNNAVMPYTFKKNWDGALFYLKNLANDGLEGWPFSHSVGYGMYGEITIEIIEDHIQMGIGRYRREYAAMDTNSSLVLNAMARPFFGFDFNFTLFKWLSFSITTGTLEFPKQDFITKNVSGLEANESGAWPESDDRNFQNMFAVGMLNLDWKYVHFDFGSSCIYPKRSEIGYFFPLIDRVVFQDTIGDNDNLALFGDLKIKIPKYASFWGSIYLDEKSAIKLNSTTAHMTRNMFAYQFGAKVNLPSKIFPFGTVSFRYTKIEPYCYTHHSINYTPWYNRYISESYTNNGSCIGYYMPPNSDEFLLTLDTRPLDALHVIGQFQLARHGADYGTGWVPGSSLYSEMDPDGRDELRKYFLKDGAYEWTTGITLGASYDFKKHGAPLILSASVSFLRSWWTTTGVTERGEGEPGKREKDSYHKVDNDEYPTKTGVVVSFSVKLFGK